MDVKSNYSSLDTSNGQYPRNRQTQEWPLLGLQCHIAAVLAQTRAASNKSLSGPMKV